MNELPLKIKAYVGEEFKGKGYSEIIYNPYEEAIIFKSSDNQEIWLDPLCLDEMLVAFSYFVSSLKKLGVKTNKEE